MFDVKGVETSVPDVELDGVLSGLPPGTANGEWGHSLFALRDVSGEHIAELYRGVGVIRSLWQGVIAKAR